MIWDFRRETRCANDSTRRPHKLVVTTMIMMIVIMVIMVMMVIVMMVMMMMVMGTLETLCK